MIQLSLYCAVGVERQSDFGWFKFAWFEPQINSSESKWKQNQRSWYVTTIGKFLHSQSQILKNIYLLINIYYYYILLYYLLVNKYLLITKSNLLI